VTASIIPGPGIPVRGLAPRSHGSEVPTPDTLSERSRVAGPVPPITVFRN